MQKALPTILVVVGVTGDLSHRKLLPSLYNLEKDNLLPRDFRILGTSRQDLKKHDLEKAVKHHIEDATDNFSQSTLDKLFKRIKIARLDLSDDKSYLRLGKILDQLEGTVEACTGRLFYLAVPPAVMPVVADLIGHKEVHKCKHDDFGKILIEKPFGRDLKSAQELSEILKSHFKEEQIYRIDHYLAKETTQNIIHFRFNNPLVEDIWNSKFIDHIQISASEKIGIEGRANFYENTGALRDMVQSHLLQLLALTTMDKPEDLDVEKVRREREKVLGLLRPFSNHQGDAVIARGQYQGYLDEVSDSESKTETFVALKTEVNNERWHGVPIYIRTGKAMKEKRTEISLVYKRNKSNDINVLSIRIQPNEGIAMRLKAKKPGLEPVLQDIVLDYSYKQSDNNIAHSAYEKLIVDAMRGEQLLFPSTSEVINSWKFIDPILKSWEKSESKPEEYDKGSWGPKCAEELLGKRNDSWQN